MRALALGAAAEEVMLTVERLQAQLAELDADVAPERQLQRAFLRRRERAELLAQRRAIQLRALHAALPVVAPDQRPAVQRRIRLLEATGVEDLSLDGLLQPPPVADDDTIA